jgi:hypothetical protein
MTTPHLVGAILLVPPVGYVAMWLLGELFILVIKNEKPEQFLLFTMAVLGAILLLI